MNKGDITETNPKELDDIDVFVYSPPCQSFSVAGKQKGIKDPRGRLFYNALTIIQEKQPKYALMENVKGLTQKRFEGLFEDMLNELELAGYNNYWQVLNAKDYGIPQNRERVFIVSIRKDVDSGEFQFPDPFDSGLRLKDVLEPQVDDRYYIQNRSVDKLVSDLQKEDALNNKTICAQRGRYDSDGKIKQQLEIQHSGLSNALTTVQKDNLVLEPSVLRYERTEYGKEIRKQYENGEIKEKIGNMRELKPRTDGISNTLTTVQKDNLIIEPNKLQFVGGIGSKDWAKDGKRLSRNYPQGNRIYDANGIACSQTAQGGGIGSYTGLYLERNTPNEIQMVEVQQLVRVRKHEVDIERLVECLRDYKSQSGLTNRQISEELNQPVTMVEHWFRRDSSFSIPDPSIWYKLKQLLDITTDEFDLSVTEFEEKEGVYEKGNRYYHEEGIAPTLTTSANERVIVEYKVRKLTPLECWRLMGFDDEDFNKARQSLMDTYYNGNDRANSQLYKQAGNSVVTRVIEEIYKNLFQEWLTY